MDRDRSALAHFTFRLTIPALGLIAMITLAIIYRLDSEYYYHLLWFIGIIPFQTPFFDFQFVLAAIDCWHHGADVYIVNPCDVLARPFNYPPLWLRFSILQGSDWTNLLGFTLAASFFLALSVLPRPRSIKELLLRLVATLSPVTTFAVERANIDLLIFVIVAAAGVLSLGPLRTRVLAYAMITVAGLLKIYPLVLMALTLRERPRVFFWVNGAVATVVLAVGLYFHVEFVKIVPNIPRGVEFSDFFGAHLLPNFLAKKMGAVLHSGPVMVDLIKPAVFAALFIAMAGWFFRVVRWRDFRVALGQLPEPEKIFLLIGAALISGCFFTGSSAGYRGIHLLFAFPGLIAMARTGRDIYVRQMAVQGCTLVIALTWAGFFAWRGFFPLFILKSWVGEVPGARLAHSLWLMSQLAWWAIATLFIAIIIGCCSNWLEAVPEWRRKTINRRIS